MPDYACGLLVVGIYLAVLVVMNRVAARLERRNTRMRSPPRKGG